MRGDPRIVKLLNDVLQKEFTGISQYFVHAMMCDNWGYKALAQRARQESIEEMKHAEKVIARILFLEGTPNMSGPTKIQVGKDVREQFESDLALEKAALEVIRPGVALCQEASDHASRQLLEMILAEEEEHVGWIEEQIGLIEKIGYQNYLALQVRA